jgi:hypothetical protein
MRPNRGDLFVNEDVLSCGPLPPFQSLGQWAGIREAYWHSLLPSGYEAPLYRELLANAEALREADSIVLWLGLGAAEQLLLAWIVQLLKQIGSDAQIQVIQFTRVGGRNVNVWGMGMLNPEHIKQHPPAEQLSPQAIFELERIWGVVTSPDPTALLSVLSEEVAHLPHIRASLRPLLHRYPDHQTGLGRWESELLRCAQERGPKVVRVIAEALGDNFDADLVGDGFLFSRLLRLGGAELAHPLVTISGDSTTMRGCEVVLTDAGQSVLAGHANAVELNGIDDWILGVHLDSRRGPVWYHKQGTLECRGLNH